MLDFCQDEIFVLLILWGEAIEKRTQFQKALQYSFLS